jgi:DNA-binding XRE family transcriptional regulator
VQKYGVQNEPPNFFGKKYCCNFAFLSKMLIFAKIIIDWIMKYAVKNRLIEVGEGKGYSRENMADELKMDTSCYCRREKGQIKVSNHEWKFCLQLYHTAIYAGCAEEVKHFF